MTARSSRLGVQYYYLFGFLLIVFVILVVTCAEISIVMVYFQLCAEDFHWWWRSFLTSASSAVYMFVYCGFYFFTKLDIVRFAPGFVFFGCVPTVVVGRPRGASPTPLVCVWV